MDSSSNPPREEPAQSRNWLDLPRDVTVTILMKLGAGEILLSAQFVCKLWYRLCKDPAMWRIVDAASSPRDLPWDSHVDMIFDAVVRSSGGLVELNIDFCLTWKLLSYLTARAKFLKCLRIRDCYDIGDNSMIEAVKRFPSLEEVEISFCPFSNKVVKAIGISCPQLKSFTLKDNAETSPMYACNEYALAIAETMPNLCHLQLIGSNMTNDGLQAILDGCPNLASLDLRCCFQLRLSASLTNLCAERIKDLRLPNEPTPSNEFITNTPGNEFVILTREVEETTYILTMLKGNKKRCLFD